MHPSLSIVRVCADRIHVPFECYAIYTQQRQRNKNINISSDMWTYEIDTRSPEKHIPRFVPVPDIEYRVDAQDDVYYEEPGDYIFVTTTFEGVVVASDGNRDGGGEGDVMKDAPKKNQQDEVATQVDTRSKQGGEGCTCGCASGENGKGATGKQRKGDKYPRRRG
ncbi:hypothetical protein ACMFMG_004059 [Clarireedia jacksonii]